MALNITPVTNHREREKGVLVYPVYSRRSGGLSVGINLYPDKKSCAYNCPYCEVFPFLNNAGFSLNQTEEDLNSVILSAQKQNIPVKDICFSGNGEPTLSPAFENAFNLAARIRTDLTPSAELVVITNGTGLQQQHIFSFLKDVASIPSVDIWLKLDAGTPDWHQKINRSSIAHEEIIKKIKEFTSCAVVTIQTMLCAINNEPPPETERKAWEALVCDLASSETGRKGSIRKVQLYGKARSAPEDPLASQLPAEYLESRAGSLRNAFKEKGIQIPINIYY